MTSASDLDETDETVDAGAAALENNSITNDGVDVVEDVADPEGL